MALYDPVADDDKAPTYTQVLGEYTLPVGTETFTFTLSKVSIKMVKEYTTIQKGKKVTATRKAERVLKLSLGRGDANLVFNRYEWPCVMLEYTHFYDSTPSVKIDFIGNLGGPETCILSPPASSVAGGVLNIYVSIALSIVDAFFPGADVYLQDAATRDILDRTDARQYQGYLTFPLSLSALKVFQGLDTTAYGGFGFFAPDRPAGRLTVLKDALARLSVYQAVYDYASNNDVRSFFFFYDHGWFFNQDATKDEILNDVETRLADLNATVTPPMDINMSFAEMAKRLSTLVETPTLSADTRMAARRFFNTLQEMFIGNFIMRYQKRVPGAWEAYKARRNVGALVPPSSPPAPPVVSTHVETVGQATLPYTLTLQPAVVQSISTAKQRLATYDPYETMGGSAWLPPAPAPASRPTPRPSMPARVSTRRTPYTRPTGAP